MEYCQIIYEKSEHILTITLNRPDQMNAIGGVMINELIDALQKADADDDIRAVIITAAGKAFCAGADLSSGATTFEQGAGTSDEKSYRDPAGQISLSIYRMRKPVIAAINGAAVGMGITMVLPADIRIASENAKFGFVFTRRGIVAEGACSWFLPRIVGVSKTLEWILSGRLILAQEALCSGLVTEKTTPQDLLPRARQIATDMAINCSPVMMAVCKRLIWNMLSCSSPIEAHLLDSRLDYWSFQQPDASEGVSAFIEKRPPNFKMRPSADIPEFFKNEQAEY
jgi:enoyl-CoA hydratase/carnithine racemase